MSNPMGQPLSDDLMIGVEAIAKFTGRSAGFFTCWRPASCRLQPAINERRESALQRHIIETERAARTARTTATA
jgi:hypothetical protein